MYCRSSCDCFNQLNVINNRFSIFHILKNIKRSTLFVTIVANRGFLSDTNQIPIKKIYIYVCMYIFNIKSSRACLRV